MRPDLDSVSGTISSVSFGDDQFVVGCWRSSPVGPIGDVMWTSGDGTRRLLTSSQREADFICTIYEFDEIHIDALSVTSDGRATTVRGHGVELDLKAGRTMRLPRRPLWVTRYLEAPIAKVTLGVHTCGVSPLGRREWYQARALRWVVEARASLDGTELQAFGRLTRPMDVGFSDPPSRPSIVAVDVAISR